MSVLLMARGRGGRVSGGGGGGGESISVALNNTAFTGQQGSTSTRTLTLTRVGGYTGTVSFAVTGLPTGTTAGFSPSTLSGATLTTTVTLTHAIDASLVTADAFTITASGSGVTDATVDGAVTVIVPVDPDEFAVNEPVGALYTFDRVFDAMTASDSMTVSQTADFALRPPSIQAESGPYSSNSYRRMYSAGMTQGEAGFIYAKPATLIEATHVYTACVFKFSPGFIQHSASTKFLYPHRRNSGSYAQDFVLQTAKPAASVAGDGEFRWKMETQGPSANYYENQNGYSQTVPYVMDSDVWYRCETEHVNNTPGVADGLLRVWISTWTGSAWTTPLLLMEYTAFEYCGVTSEGWWPLWTGDTTWRWNGFFGGSASTALPADQYVYFNRARVTVLATR